MQLLLIGSGSVYWMTVFGDYISNCGEDLRGASTCTSVTFGIMSIVDDLNYCGHAHRSCFFCVDFTDIWSSNRVYCVRHCAC